MRPLHPLIRRENPRVDVRLKFANCGDSSAGLKNGAKPKPDAWVAGLLLA
jgi:hypothetical protein